jgi:predicted DNA-binding protein with PD1-like motif
LNQAVIQGGKAMKSKVIHEDAERTIALVFEAGEEVVALLHQFAREQGLSASRLSAIGALQRATLGYFDWQRKDYERIEVDEQVEVLSLLGDIALDGDQPKVHAHVVLGRRDGSTVGGHLLAAVVRPTLEVLLIESPSYLRRKCDPISGLALIDLDR